MSDRRQSDSERAWHLWKGPGVIWLALVALFAVSLASAYLPLGRGNVAVNLGIAVMMIALLVTFLMDLRNAKLLIRIVAAAGVFWSILMFVLTFNDYLTRHY